MKKKRKVIDSMVCHIYSLIGIDRPHNHDAIVEYIFDDVNETADPEDWHSGDVDIAFRRFLEKGYDI